MMSQQNDAKRLAPAVAGGSARFGAILALCVLSVACSQDRGPSNLQGLDSACGVEETYRNASVTVLSTNCTLSRAEALDALGTSIAGSVATGLADNVIAKVLGTSSKRILGWASVFADLQTGSEFIQNPLRMFPVAEQVERAPLRVGTALFPTIREWEAPLSKQGDSVGALPVIDFLASPFSRYYWYEDWPIWLQYQYKNQPVVEKRILTGAEVERHIRKDRCHVLILDADLAFPVREVMAGCGAGEACGVAMVVISGDPDRLGVYRSTVQLELLR